VCEILNNQKKAVWLNRKSLDWALREVAEQGQEQIVKLLLDKGADTNATGEYGYTALVLASQKGTGGLSDCCSRRAQTLMLLSGMRTLPW
jgi:ankyrin repeat protein